MDVVAAEPQFIDHAAPVYLALPPSLRGRFIVPDDLGDRARSRGIEPATFPVSILRAGQPPRAVVEPGPQAFVVSIGDTKIARRLGYRRFAFMEHGAGQAYRGRGSFDRHPSYAGGSDREDTELFLVPNEYSARLWRDAYPSARVEIVGCPRLDDLPPRVPGGPTPTVAVSFHWPAFVSPEAETAFGYYWPVLRRLSQRFHVIGHAHPKGDWPTRMARYYARMGIEFVPDFDDVCRRADVYAVDNSSTLFEFAATGRPVVVLNSPNYRRDVNHGLRFWDAADVGIQVDRPEDLAEAVALAVKDAPSSAANREAALSLVYAYRSGGAARAAAALAAWSDVEVAA